MTLRAENLAFGFAHTPEALRDASALAHPGRITALIGPNAAGKTTLLRLLLGLLTPLRGTAFLGSDPVLSFSPERRARRMAYVAQRPQVDADFTVAQVVALGRYASAPSPAAVQSALEACDVAHLADRSFYDLSVGQQQLTALARALAQVDTPADPSTPRAILLDEPTAALDPRHALTVMRILRARADAGFVILAVFHDLVLAARFADDIWALSQGCILAAGPRSQVLTSPLLNQIYGTPFAFLDGSIPVPIQSP